MPGVGRDPKGSHRSQDLFHSSMVNTQQDLMGADRRTQAMYFCSNIAFSSLPVFFPTIIKEYANALYFIHHFLTRKDGSFRSDFTSSFNTTLSCSFPHGPSNSIPLRPLTYTQRLRRVPCPSRLLRLRNNSNHGLRGGQRQMALYRCLPCSYGFLLRRDDDYYLDHKQSRFRVQERHGPRVAELYRAVRTSLWSTLISR